jgi:hypothetical protein
VTNQHGKEEPEPSDDNATQFETGTEATPSARSDAGAPLIGWKLFEHERREREAGRTRRRSAATLARCEECGRHGGVFVRIRLDTNLRPTERRLCGECADQLGFTRDPLRLMPLLPGI